MKNQTYRIEYLDSIRGIAAMIVVVFHFIGWKWNETIEYKIATFIFNGTEAVSFFFVLSGFVLSHSYINSNRKIKLGNYIYRRVLRLYPAYIITVMIMFFYGLRHNFTIETIFTQLQRPNLLKELLMFQKTHHLYFPGWTLQVEIIYSLIIILLILLCKRNVYLLFIPLICCYFIGSPDLRLYMNHFILGVFLSIIYPNIKNTPFSKSKLFRWRWALFFLIFVMFSFVNLAKFIKPIDDLFHWFWTYNIRWAHFSGYAAFLTLIIVIMSSKIQRILTNPILLYLGKISYSLYLIHWFFVVFIMDYWEKWGQFLGEGGLRFITMFIIFVSTSIIAAHLMYRFIELPFIKLSKRGWSNIKNR